MLSVSVIVPVHNGGNAFVRCLESLTRHASAADEIIIVADGETDGVWRQAYASRAEVLVNETKLGPAAARNRGAKAATGDVLFFIDADVCIQADTIGLIRETFLEDSSISAVFGSYDDEPAAESFLSQYRNLLHHFTHQRAGEEASTFWCGCGAIRTDVFKKAGGFDDMYSSACIEDIELGYRLTRAGHRIILRKDIQVKHLKYWSAHNMIRTDVLARALPWSELMLSNRDMPRDLNLRVENRLSVVLVYVTLGLVVLSFSVGGMLPAAAFLTAIFVVLNLPFYRLLMRKRGVMFTVAAIPWHWFFYLYSGLGFSLAACRLAIRSLVSKVGLSHSAARTSMKLPKTTPRAKWEDVSI